MGIREVRVRVGRQRPEPQRGARMAGRVEALLRLLWPLDRAQPRSAGDAGGERFCRACDRMVTPVARNVWGKVAWFVAVAQLVAVIVSVFACFTPISPWKGFRRWLVAWPAAIHPVGLGVAAAVVAAMATAGFADSLDERAERAAVCPECHGVLGARPSQRGDRTD